MRSSSNDAWFVQDSRGASSSWQGGCPPIAEHQERYPPVPQQHVIFPNPGYKIEANICHLDVKRSARRPGPIASFLRHCSTMESPNVPSYVRGGPQPADDIVFLCRDASMENLQHLQRYSEKFQFETTCGHLWANEIQYQIMDEHEKVQNWISGMTDELNRLRRIQPAWIQHLISREPATSDVDGPSFQLPAGTSIIQCNVYGPNEARTCLKESFHGKRSQESDSRSRSMG